MQRIKIRTSPKPLTRYELMGRTVTVKTQLKREVDSNGVAEWKSVELEFPYKAGWVVGFRTVYNGFIPEPETDEWGLRYAAPNFSIVQAIPCMLVAYQPNTKPVHVPLNDTDFFLGGMPKTPASRLTEEDKQRIREALKNAPRDSKGRFLKPEVLSQ